VNLCRMTEIRTSSESRRLDAVVGVWKLGSTNEPGRSWGGRTRLRCVDERFKLV
jgi:hypothetical protein